MEGTQQKIHFRFLSKIVLLHKVFVAPLLIWICDLCFYLGGLGLEDFLGGGGVGRGGEKLEIKLKLRPAGATDCLAKFCNIWSYL